MRCNKFCKSLLSGNNSIFDRHSPLKFITLSLQQTKRFIELNIWPTQCYRHLISATLIPFYLYTHWLSLKLHRCSENIDKAHCESNHPVWRTKRPTCYNFCYELFMYFRPHSHKIGEIINRPYRTTLGTLSSAWKLCHLTPPVTTSVANLGNRFSIQIINRWE